MSNFDSSAIRALVFDVFAPHSKLRAAVTPAHRGRGATKPPPACVIASRPRCIPSDSPQPGDRAGERPASGPPIDQATLRFHPS